MNKQENQQETHIILQQRVLTCKQGKKQPKVRANQGHPQANMQTVWIRMTKHCSRDIFS